MDVHLSTGLAAVTAKAIQRDIIDRIGANTLNIDFELDDL
jgi:hypothetical protein